MYELHENEQYFFDEPTLERLGSFLAGFESPCCLCAPLLGKWLVEHGHPVTILDVDERFGELPGFRRFDLHRPEWLGEEFDVVFCDPPFFNLSLSRLFAGIRMVARNDFTQPLLVSYLVRREQANLGTFAPFGLTPTGYRPTYQTLKKIEKNEIEVFGNLPPERLADLTR